MSRCLFLSFAIPAWKFIFIYVLICVDNFQHMEINMWLLNLTGVITDIIIFQNFKNLTWPAVLSVKYDIIYTLTAL